MSDPPFILDEAAIAKAQQAWRAQDEATFGKRDAESIKRRHEALLDLLCAHVPLNRETRPLESAPSTPKKSLQWPPY